MKKNSKMLSFHGTGVTYQHKQPQAFNSYDDSGFGEW